MKIEKILYYLSSMVLFNVFYIIKLLEKIEGISILNANGNLDINNLFNFISIGVAGILFVIGVGYTVVLFSTDYSVQKGETGVNFQIDKVVDITTSEFFGKFSLLILTGLTIGGISLWWGLIIYMLFFAVIGIMYIRFDMLYFNPLLIIFGFHIYRAEGFVEDAYKNYYFISKENICKQMVINFTMTNKTIIRLKGKNK